MLVETVCQEQLGGVAKSVNRGSLDNAHKVEFQVCWVIANTPTCNVVDGVMTRDEISGVGNEGNRVGNPDHDGIYISILAVCLPW